MNNLIRLYYTSLKFLLPSIIIYMKQNDPKDQTYILFAITAAGVVPCGGPKKSPRTSSIVQIILSFRSFEISKDIQSVQNTHF